MKIYTQKAHVESDCWYFFLVLFGCLQYMNIEHTHIFPFKMRCYESKQVRNFWNLSTLERYTLRFIKIIHSLWDLWSDSLHNDCEPLCCFLVSFVSHRGVVNCFNLFMPYIETMELNFWWITTVPFPHSTLPIPPFTHETKSHQEKVVNLDTIHMPLWRRTPYAAYTIIRSHTIGIIFG